MLHRAIIPVLIILMACGGQGNNNQKSDTTATKKTVSELKDTVAQNTTPVNAELSAFARFISGMEGENALPATGKKIWQNFAKNTDDKWKILDERIGGRIAAWVKENPKNVNAEPNTLFYPFAGGDFYYANLFFPKQDTVIMLGLEPGGSIFNPENVADSTLIQYYSNLEHTMFFPHRLGFFRTKSMANDFNRGPLNGTIHTVLFYMARFNYNIHYISHFNLDKDGNETEIADGAKPEKNLKRTAYKIGFSTEKNGAVKELIYISYDASDAYLKSHTGLMGYLEKRKKVVTFFKAASYLMHEEYFSTIRNYVKTHTVRLMQDDSGLPYKFMVDNGFNVSLLGEYTRTIKLFAGRFQPDLKKAYEEAKPAKLPFMIGYNAEFHECNLQSAVKK